MKFYPTSPFTSSSSPSSNSICSTPSVESTSSASSASSTSSLSFLVGNSLSGLSTYETNPLLNRPCPIISRNESLAPSYVEPVEVIPIRQHPRRCSEAKSQPPPSLVRQTDRKGQFVENLVESATTLVAAIWPLSEPACPAIPGFSQSHSVLPLKTYIQETLKRSKTRFSTLQVALYYLILLKEVIPPCNFTMEQPDNNPHRIALQCGRRMFLTALMLASKYLQDRNYSAKAWSKITGLQVKEINLNEIAFLLAIDWKLHVQETTFERWQNILIKYSNINMKAYWGTAVMSLKPDLNCPTSIHALLPTPPPSPPFMEPMVTMPAPESWVALRPMERRSSPLSRANNVCSTPAASTTSRGAMCAAMSIAALTSSQRNLKDSGDLATTTEVANQAALSVETCFTFTPSKLPSTSPSDTSPTSPGSMISDHSSQFSRSSSISSGSSGASPPHPSLLHRATKNARNRKVGSDRYNEVTIVGSSWDDCTSTNSITASPEVYLDLYEETMASRKRPIRSAFDNDVSLGEVRSDLCDYSELQQEVRGMLRALSDAEQMHPLKQYPLARFPSKRACVDATDFEVPQVDSRNYIRPRSGPGMWQGIL